MGLYVPVDATDENRNVRNADGRDEDLELAVRPDLVSLGALRLGRLHVLVDADEVICAHDAEKGQHDDLQGDAGDDGAVAVALQRGVRAAGRCCDAAADGLHDEASDVGREEDARVPDGRDAGRCRAQGEGGVLEREVDGHADECGSEDDGADLQLKGAFVERVLVQQDTTDVAYQQQS